MPILSRFLLLLFVSLTLALGSTEKAQANHIIGGEITWTCQGNGSYIFYLKLYKDCTQNTNVGTSQSLLVLNHPSISAIPLTLQNQQDITQPGCGVSCNGAVAGNVAVEEYTFASAPITLGSTPPAQGFEFVYNQCCRNDVTNMVSAINYTIYYRAVMYPLNGLDTDPCYDNSPQFAERPSALLCSGYELSYNSNAIDVDGDSLAYSFVPAAHENGTVPYAAGYSHEVPLPGPTLDPSYDQVTIDPVTGQIVYQSPGGLQGKWNIAYVVRAYRCGQLISENLREMQVWIIPCSEPNNTPVVNAPAWTAPAGVSGYDITVNAGDLVSFTLEGVDNDVINGNPQTLTFDAVGAQFGTGFTNANAGCQTPPCATLTNSTPPVTSVGTIGTTFTWQTECQHVSVQDQCANFSNTYNFIFKYRDDYCPARSTNYVNVSITVIGESVLPSPEPHCASVLPGGGVQVSWQTITDNSNPPSFVAYAIMHSLNANGPFTEVGTVTNINTGTFTHAGASATGPNYYQVRTRSGCNGAVLAPAEYTISSIFLIVTNNVQTADLSWNAVTTPPLPSSNGNGQGLYQIFREYPAGSWNQIGTTFGLTWTDPVTVCNEQVNYYVQLTDNLPCTSVSNIDGDVLNNPAQPAPQFIDSVTVDLATQQALIGWSPNAELNVVEYDVEQNPDLIAWTVVHTAVGYTTTSWLNTSSNAQNESEYYRIKARNNCLATGLPGDNYQRTIFLEVALDTCAHVSTLTWSPYEIWLNGVREYEVLVSLNGGPEERIGTTSDTVLTFVHEGLSQLANYCYRVRAVQNTVGRITSTSNLACVYVYVPKRPEYSYQYNVTVNATSDAIEQYFFVDSTAGYIGFDILRGLEADQLEPIDFIDWNPSSRYYQITDNTARPKSRSYYYAAVGIDSCDQNADTLNLSRTIYLEAVANTDRTNDLEWNAYEGWLGDVAAQNIWRNYDGNWELIATVPPSQLTYTDNIEEFITGEGEFCYYIEAMEGSGPFISPDFVRFQEISRSNEDCALQFPNVFVPNAFVPEGVNTQFLPVTVYVDYSDYVFEVYSRWGERIFYTTDPERGWTGIMNGKPAPQGAYGYHIRFVSSTGQVFDKHGTVTLIR
jgi:gliding motility-associated-like protein